ncbi:hypothetical protein GDO78_015227 [Eleutherodactylus coqui]|uniref:Glutathione S-transferase n=1 Tax=Eleutherodactylus coqui TaxID=57060 RepID=A0A8J6EDU1_ELECQ|nr:hypothetical protein GDO78_015227 [Eleutherodactylus coqui]
MSGYVITYFPLRGRAEVIRMLLADQGASWTEEEVQTADWFGGESDLKQQAVFGQLPQFKDGDFVLYQSNSILRYLGRKYGISGGSNQESALIDMVNDGVEDLRVKYIRFVFFEFETGKEKYESELAKHLSAFERILSQNCNGTKYVVGDKVMTTKVKYKRFCKNSPIGIVRRGWQSGPGLPTSCKATVY